MAEADGTMMRRAGGVPVLDKRAGAAGEAVAAVGVADLKDRAGHRLGLRAQQRKLATGLFDHRKQGDRAVLDGHLDGHAATDLAMVDLERAHLGLALGNARQHHADLGVIYCDQPLDTLRDADAVVLVTEWPDYRNLDWEELKETLNNLLILDGRNFLDRHELERLGYRYVGIGR